MVRTIRQRWRTDENLRVERGSIRAPGPSATVRYASSAELNFLGCDREQALLLPPSLREWLGDDHLVLDVVAEIALGEFYGAHRADGHGRAAHDPAMMVALLR